MATNESLSPLDATFLELEDADHSAHMHIGAILVFDPLPGGGHAEPRRACERHVDRRLGGAAALPQAPLRSPGPAGCTGPSGSPTPRFDMKVHVTPRGAARARRRARAAAPGRRTSGRTASTAAARCGAIVLLEGLAGGRWALATKTHHCMVDGVGSIDVGTVLLDLQAHGARWHAPRAAAHPVQADGRPGPLRRLASVPVRATEARGSAWRAIRAARPTPRARRAAWSSCSSATSSSPRRTPASTPRSASTAASRSATCRSTTSRPSSAPSAAPSTTSCSTS